MDFSVRNFATLEIFGIEVWITETLVNMWIVMAIMIGLAIVIRIKLYLNKKADPDAYINNPKGLQNVIETIVETFDGFVRKTAGDRLAYLGHWFFTVFFFILFSNFSGILLRPPTADWTVTFAMALATFILIQAMGLKYRPKAYLKSFFQPIFLFFPLNVIGELARPVSLSFRLFGNILGGAIILGLIYGIAPVVARFIFPVALHIYFDLAMGFLQTYIFTVLSLSFIGSMAGTNESV